MSWYWVPVSGQRKKPHFLSTHTASRAESTYQFPHVAEAEMDANTLIITTAKDIAKNDFRFKDISPFMQ